VGKTPAAWPVPDGLLACGCADSAGVVGGDLVIGELVIFVAGAREPLAAIGVCDPAFAATGCGGEPEAGAATESVRTGGRLFANGAGSTAGGVARAAGAPGVVCDLAAGLPAVLAGDSLPRREGAAVWRCTEAVSRGLTGGAGVVEGVATELGGAVDCEFTSEADG
jgi:hypothetical protein